ILTSLFLFLTLRLILPTGVSAHCPLCVAGAGIGLSVARFFGIDDSISGIWLGAFLAAVSFWIDTSLSKKIKHFLVRPLTYVAMFAVTIWSIYAFNDIATSNFKFFLLNKHAGSVLGMDKLIFGMVTGGIVFYLVDLVNSFIIRRNGKVLFPFQRLLVSLGSMVLLSMVVYLLINYLV
ncbi:hypothetical protein HY045_02575, partial [Candidatus Woesebacteria bacterium]|nr:hypothetical protein [Candidatus Woesebacteria bacterium]